MAKVHEEVLVVKITTLLPDSSQMKPIMDSDNISALTEVIVQLAGNNKTLVEIESAE